MTGADGGSPQRTPWHGRARMTKPFSGRRPPRGLVRPVLTCAVRLAGVLFQFLECGLADLLMLAMGSAQLVVGGVLEREQ